MSGVTNRKSLLTIAANKKSAAIMFANKNKKEI